MNRCQYGVWTLFRLSARCAASSWVAMSFRSLSSFRVGASPIGGTHEISNGSSSAPPAKNVRGHSRLHSVMPGDNRPDEIIYPQ